VDGQRLVIVNLHNTNAMSEYKLEILDKEFPVYTELVTALDIRRYGVQTGNYSINEHSISAETITSEHLRIKYPSGEILEVPTIKGMKIEWGHRLALFRDSGSTNKRVLAILNIDTHLVGYSIRNFSYYYSLSPN